VGVTLKIAAAAAPVETQAKVVAASKTAKQNGGDRGSGGRLKRRTHRKTQQQCAALRICKGGVGAGVHASLRAIAETGTSACLAVELRRGERRRSSAAAAWQRLREAWRHYTIATNDFFRKSRYSMTA
jgi:hypothetical protein